MLLEAPRAEVSPVVEADEWSTVRRGEVVEMESGEGFSPVDKFSLNSFL